MNVSEYTKLLSKPESVSDSQTAALDTIVSEFPYFQSARALRLKGLYSQNSFQYNYALKVTAAFTTDRSVLFDFITSDTFTAIHKGLYEQKLADLMGIEVSGSEIVSKSSSEPEADKVEQSILTSIRESQTPAQEETIEIESVEIVPEVVQIAETIHEVAATPEQIKAPEDVVIEPETVNEIQVVTQTVATPEEILEIGKPLLFSPDEKHSFQEWLQLSKLQIISREPAKIEAGQPDEAALEKIKKKELIDQFIKANPKIPPVRGEVKPASPVSPFREDTTALMTETLARVYLEQKKYQKAIQAYEILILKYPEKSSFFADRISEVKNLQQNNTQQ